MKSLYFDEKSSKKIIESGWNSSHYRDCQLDSLYIRNGIALPLTKAVSRFGFISGEVGVFDNNYDYVPGTGMEELSFVDLSFDNKIDYVDETVIWGGFLFDHYGHFLLQSTSRLYEFFRNNKEIPIVFSVSNKKNIPQFIKDFFKLCDIPENKVIYIDRQTRFKLIICPEISSGYYRYWTNEFLIPFEYAAKNVEPAKYKKIFFSRKYWNGKVKCFGENIIEKIFNQNGFHSVYMEKLSLQEQISIIKGGEIFAGINGTCFHNLLFAKNKTLIILNRNEEVDSQYIVNEASNSVCYCIKAYENPLPTAHPDGPFIVGVTHFFKEFCNDYGIDVFNRSFYPAKYLKPFIKNYISTYSVDWQYQELIFRNKNIIDPVDFISIINILNFSYLKFVFLYFRYILSISKEARKNNKKRFLNYKNIYKNIEFKY